MLRDDAFKRVRVLRLRVDEPRREREKILVILRLPRGGESGERPAVETVDEGYNVVIFRPFMLRAPLARGLYRAFVRFRAGVAEKRLFQPRAHGERLGKLHAGIGVIKIGRMRYLFHLRAHRVRPLSVRIAEDVDAYAAAEIYVSPAVRVPNVRPLSADEPHGKARVCRRNVQFVLFFRRHMFSPDTNIVPMPSSVRVSIRMEWGTLPSMMNTFFTPRRIASMQQPTFGIIPPESLP